MIVVHGTQDVPAAARGGVLAIGNFDGVHRGHQALIAAATREARQHGWPAGAIVFEPHPREFFQPDKPHFRLTPLPRKLALLEGLGLDMAVVVRFDAALAGLSAETFVDRVLVQGLGVRHVVVGYDFRFGKGRAGDPETLRQGRGRAWLRGDGGGPGGGGRRGILLQCGARRAGARRRRGRGRACSGHWWRVAGTVVGGARRGTGLGYPTANLMLPTGTALAHGIYAVRAYCDGQRLDGAAYLGTRPTFDDGEAVLEVFLFDFDGDLYGRAMEVEFIGFVRADAKFASAAALQEQMARDVERAREILAAAPAAPVAVG